MIRTSATQANREYYKFGYTLDDYVVMCPTCGAEKTPYSGNGSYNPYHTHTVEYACCEAIWQYPSQFLPLPDGNGNHDIDWYEFMRILDKNSPFFSSDNMRFFNGKRYPDLFAVPDLGYIILHSIQYKSIRECWPREYRLSFVDPSCSIHRLNDIRPDLRQARAAAKRLAVSGFILEDHCY